MAERLDAEAGIASLDEQIKQARTEISSDGYEMSVGEILNLYREKEININPDFQRLFRWDETRKTRFIESLLLGIPIPPIFVYQDAKGVWELIDGLQRLSTLFEFTGILRQGATETTHPPSVLEGTKFLPGLAGRTWEGEDEEGQLGIGHAAQLQIKRARIRVEILKQESDPKAKYELFQRLNTGGASLSEQEVRNCIAVMLNKPFYEWLRTLAGDTAFLTTINQTDYALERQAATELALRFLVFLNVPYPSGWDVHEYLDEGLMKIATDPAFDMACEGQRFAEVFGLLYTALGDRAFRRWDGSVFTGKFLMSVFEVVATGVARNLKSIQALGDNEATKFIVQRCKDLWSDQTFNQNSGAGVRGTTRLTNLLPMAEGFFRP